MPVTFYILAGFLLVAAVAAMSFRNLVHCALALAVSFMGLAGLFLQLDAQFAGLVQILVYVGAVAILIVFAILLTRGGDSTEKPRHQPGWWMGIWIAVLVFGTTMFAVLSTGALKATTGQPPALTVRAVGNELMTRYVLPMEVMALLLTSALIGAILIALQDRSGRKDNPPKP